MAWYNIWALSSRRGRREIGWGIALELVVGHKAFFFPAQTIYAWVPTPICSLLGRALVEGSLVGDTLRRASLQGLLVLILNSSALPLSSHSG